MLTVWERGRIEGWTPGPERQRRFEGQHQTPQQLINACRGDPDPARNNTNTSKTPSKAPILTVITLSHRKAVKSTHQPHRFQLLPCLSCLTEPQRRTKATDWVWKAWHGADKIRSTPTLVCNGCTFPMHESEPRPLFWKETKTIAFSHVGIWAITMVRYQYCFPILLAARGG